LEFDIFKNKEILQKIIQEAIHIFYLLYDE